MRCRHEGCSCLVADEAGYCRRHGGPARARRERRQNASPARKSGGSYRPDGTRGACPVGQGLSRCARKDAAAREATQGKPEAA